MKIIGLNIGIVKYSCIKCGEHKGGSEFYKVKTNRSGLSWVCKVCARRVSLDRLRTRKGQLGKLYNSQYCNSKMRGHAPPAYSKEELGVWINSQPHADELYKTWKESGYLKRLVPSVDRIKGDIPYTFSNIQLMSWEDHIKKTHEELELVEMRMLSQLNKRKSKADEIMRDLEKLVKK